MTDITQKYELSVLTPTVSFKETGTYQIIDENHDLVKWVYHDTWFPGSLHMRLRSGERMTLSLKKPMVGVTVPITVRITPVPAPRAHMLPALTTEMLMSERERQDARYKKEAERLHAEIVSQARNGGDEINIIASNELGLVQDVVDQMRALGFTAYTRDPHSKKGAIMFRRGNALNY